MRNRIFTNSVRLIKNSFPRFLSLIVISMLGVFTFSGLGATAPDMIKTLDNYLDSLNTYDVKVVSTMGLVEEDILELEKINGILDVEGSYSKDLLISYLKDEFVINVSSLGTKINEVSLIEGRLPKKNGELVVEENLLIKNNLEIGDRIVFDDEEFVEKEFVIVGTVDSSLYFNTVVSTSDRGKTTVGTGTINFYSFCLDSNFKQDYYSSIYITVRGAKKLETASDKYIDVVDKVVSKLNKIKSVQEEKRYNQIYNEALNEIKKKEDEGNRKFDDAKNELDLAKTKLDTTKNDLNVFNNNLITAKNDLNNLYNSLEEAKITYNKSLIDNGINEEEIDQNILTLEQNILILEEKINTLVSLGEDVSLYEAELTKMNDTLLNLTQIKETKVKLIETENMYLNGIQEYNNSYSFYNESLNTYNYNLEQYNSSLNVYNEERDAFNKLIQESMDKLSEIKMPIWYLYDRGDHLTYREYVDDTNSLSNLAKLFPMVFFAVSVLVSLISMNRMVEDDRGEIGTLKSLGFSNRHIIFKYLLFSALAVFLGGVIGSLLGVTTLPLLIFKIYKILFDVPNFVLSLNLSNTLVGFVLSFICVCGSTIYTALSVLKEKPSALMRPKAPKSGKRVFLEKITFIWNNISFSNKVTIRNLFRYKKRVFVTVIGIAGCCALVLCGFGIKDSIVDIARVQYREIFKFDGMVFTDEINDTEINEMFNDDRITSITRVESLSGILKGTDVNLFIAEDSESLGNVVNLYDVNTDEKVTLEKGKVVITEKLADLKKVGVGDKIQVMDVNNNVYLFEISAVVKNYFEHYIFIDDDTFISSGGEFVSNVIYINTVNLSKEDKDLLAEKLLKNEKVINVSYVSVLINTVTNMLSSLDTVIAILIVLAALLSFVVLYNLSNININERKREIATLKVLGFYDKEVDNYITKENIILTIVGILLGLVLGYFLTSGIILTVEIEKARFLRRVSFNSYVYAACISLLFTIIVNFVTHFSLKKIDMIESLKSVE